MKTEAGRARACNGARSRASTNKQDKLKRNNYEKELARLHVELVKLQGWVVQNGVKV